jgi:hypothetical protein
MVMQDMLDVCVLESDDDEDDAKGTTSGACHSWQPAPTAISSAEQHAEKPAGPPATKTGSFLDVQQACSC